MTKYTLTMTEDQAQAVMYALEAYSRACSGQFDMLLNSCGRNFGDGAYRHATDDTIKSIVFPELKANESYGIHSKSMDRLAKIAWDAYQYLRREISWHRAGLDWRKHNRNWIQMMGVNYDTPFHTSDSGPFETSVREER